MKHEILTSNGFPVQLVRYCKYHDKDCLIFMKESMPDQQGYVTVHISEVKNDNGLMAVAADDEYAKEIVKTIANEVKNNMPLSVTDLNYNDLDGINILSDKAFRVFPNYAECLEKNRTVFENVQEEKETNSFNFDFNTTLDTESDDSESDGNPFNISTNDISNQGEDYQKLYLEQLEEIKNLKSEIEIYKSKIETLKSIINN